MPELEELPRFPLSPSTPVSSPTVPVAEQPAISTDKASAPEHAPEIAVHQPESVQTPPHRYPQRQRHPPERFHDLTWESNKERKRRCNVWTIAHYL